MAATGLYAQIAMKQGEIDGLMMTLGMMDHPATDANEATGLYKQLADAQAMTEGYKGMIGSMDDPALAPTAASMRSWPPSKPRSTACKVNWTT